MIKRLKGMRNTNGAVLKDGLVFTYKGRVYDLLDFTPEMVSMDFIFKSLSNQTRFLGNTTNQAEITFSYTIAQHCVLGSQTLLLMGRPKEAYYFLFHESEESYMNDVISPLKKLLPLYKEMSNKISQIIYEKLSVPLDVDHAIIKMVDLNLYEYESTIMQGSSFNFDCWDREKAEKATYNQLKICDKFLLLDEKELMTGDNNHSPKIIITSTPTGNNFFKELYDDQKSNDLWLQSIMKQNEDFTMADQRVMTGIVKRDYREQYDGVKVYVSEILLQEMNHFDINSFFMVNLYDMIQDLSDIYKGKKEPDAGVSVNLIKTNDTYALYIGNTDFEVSISSNKFGAILSMIPKKGMILGCIIEGNANLRDYISLLRKYFKKHVAATSLEDITIH